VGEGLEVDLAGRQRAEEIRGVVIAVLHAAQKALFDGGTRGADRVDGGLEILCRVQETDRWTGQSRE